MYSLLFVRFCRCSNLIVVDEAVDYASNDEVVKGKAEPSVTGTDINKKGQ
jgi:hypothetical protein